MAKAKTPPVAPHAPMGAAVEKMFLLPPGWLADLWEEQGLTQEQVDVKLAEWRARHA